MIGGWLAALSVVPMAEAQVSYCLPQQPPARILSADLDSPMTYRVVDVGGRKILYAAGGIESGEAARLSAALARSAGVEEVWLHSGGGVLREGLEMGRIIKRSGLPTRVPSGRLCASACTFVFLGGPVRFVDEDTWYGVHSFSKYFDLKNVGNYVAVINQFIRANDARGLQNFLMAQEQQNAQLAADCAKFLIEMSASLEFLTGTLGQKQLGMCYLNRAGLSRYNVANAQ